MNLTKNFTLEELCATSKPYGNTPTPSVVKNLTELAEKILQPLRNAYGKPIIVNSGYRSPKVNAAVGGSPTSQHMTGQAADIRPKDRKEMKKLFDLCISLKLPFDQLIDEYNYSWIHVSYSSRNRRQILHLKK